MPLFSTVLSLFMGSPSKENMGNNNTMSNGCQSASADTSLDKSPLLQKLNRMHGDSVILNNTTSFCPKEGKKSSKKRTRTVSSDDEEIEPNSEKRRRVFVSASDEPLIIQTENSCAKEILSCDSISKQIEPNSEKKRRVFGSASDEPLNTQAENSCAKEILSCDSISKETSCSLLPDSNRKSPRTKSSQESELNDIENVEENMRSGGISEEGNFPRYSDTSDNGSACASEDSSHSLGIPLVPDTDLCGSEKGEGKTLSCDRENMDNNTGGDQVVCESSNGGHVACEEDEENMLIAKQISEGALTASMLDQEKKLHEQHLEDEKEIVSKAMEEWEMTVEQQRYARLQHLLQKSNVYSSFLLQRIEQQRLQNEQRKTREARKAEKTKKENSELSPQTVPDTKPTRKSKGKTTGYNISDYVDTEALRRSSRESTRESTAAQCVPEQAETQTFSIAHHSEETDASQNKTAGYRTPKLLTGGTLRDYQIEGVEWLKVLFENGINGILADEMGLGKTVQCIALLAYLIERGVRGPFLVTAPLSTLPNWIAEFRRFTPGICSLIYHGTPEERAVMRKRFAKVYGKKPLDSYPVAITSYDIVMKDRKHLVGYNWKYIIVDEGHRIKNMKCKLIRELKAFPSANRLLLTGTPLQNNLSELWSLLNFLLPDIFNDLNSFQALFDFNDDDKNEKIIAQEREHHVLDTLHGILNPFLLRRLKSDVSLDVPPKKEVFVYAPLTSKQKHWYQLLLDKNGFIDKLKAEKEVSPSFTPTGRVRRKCSRANYTIFDDDNVEYEDLVKILAEENERIRDMPETNSTPLTVERNIKVANILMMLRKACMHPYLLEYPLDPETQDYRMDEELITCSGKTLLLDQMLPELKKRGHKILLFSQMTKLLDILEDFCAIRQYKYSRIDGSMKLEDRQAQIDDFNTEPEIFIFLLSTRAGGLGLNLTAADTVIIYDSDWNPQQDLQAQDRCHRIGQTKPVVVYRLITANTVDQRIVEVAHDKRTLEKMVIHKEKFKGVRDGKSMTAKELTELLQSTDHTAAINSKGITSTRVLSDEQLNKLLDRSDLLSGVAPVPEISDDDNQMFRIVETPSQSI